MSNDLIVANRIETVKVF